MQAITVIAARDYIRNHQRFQQFQCNICFDICVRPTRCNGSCHKIFCMRCVSEWRTQNDKCPLRCSNPFLVTILPQLQIEFNCPYDKQKCQQKIMCLDQFNDHHKKCSYVPQDEVYRQKMKSQYKCLLGHQLQFFIGSYDQMCNSQCSLCHSKKLCRTICRQCNSSLFCVQCRIPPCIKGKCPLGHQMNHLRISNLAYICDICGISTAISNKGVYDDQQCNFGLCDECFQKLPQHQDEGMPKVKINSNKENQCQLGHKLKFVNCQNNFDTCSSCKKYKQCAKNCQECQKSYCLSCKIMLIQGDQTCPLGHQFIKIENKVNQQNSLKCMKCDSTQEFYFCDKQCFVRICQKCFIYGLVLNSQKDRFVQNITCKNNHCLRFYSGEEDSLSGCTLCQKQSPIKLFCDFCQESERCYCCECKPLSKFDTCYFGHKIKPISAQSKKTCQICRKKKSKMEGCRKCSFYLCVKCKGDQKDKKQENQQDSMMVDESEQENSIVPQ